MRRIGFFDLKLVALLKSKKSRFEKRPYKCDLKNIWFWAARTNRRDICNFMGLRALIHSGFWARINCPRAAQPTVHLAAVLKSDPKIISGSPSRQKTWRRIATSSLLGTVGANHAHCTVL